MSPRKLYLTLARAEAVTWTLLIIGMIAKYSGLTDALIFPFGATHGFVFFMYLATTVLVWVNEKWGTGLGLTGLASAILPYATIPFERHVEKTGRLSDRWRVLAEDFQPATAPEKLLRWILRNPVLAAVLILVVISVVFFLLLQAGPPNEWFS